MALSQYQNLDIEKVVAIDFGSFGFASCFCPPNAPKDQRMVNTVSMNATSTEINKNLAALLVDKATLETIAIGYDAEEQYAKAIEKNEGDKVMYFQHFKPYLYSKDHLKKNVKVLSADNESSLALSDLITKSFEAVMKQSLIAINEVHKLAGIALIDSPQTIYWVMSVPAIWDEMSKEMMKYCATQAGMKYFSLGSEPICTVFHVLHNTKLDIKKNKNQFIVLDAGGGTVDACCIDINLDEQYVNELHFGEGLFTGGLRVDDRFIELLEELLPTDVVETIKHSKCGQWVRQKQEFITSKFSLPLEFEEFTDGWNVDFCFFIQQWLAQKKKKRKKDKTYKEFQNKVKSYSVPKLPTIKNKQEVKQEDDEDKDEDEDMISGVFKLGKNNIKIRKEGWLYLHEEVFVKIVSFLRKLCSHSAVADCDNIILSGGFANSEYLKDRLKKEFPQKTFLVPKHPHLAVVKGALYWVDQAANISTTVSSNTHNDDADDDEKKTNGIFKLNETRAKYTYGISTDRRWNADKDSDARKKIVGNEAIVENAFERLVIRNEKYEDGYTEDFDYWIPSNTEKVNIELYASEDPFCRYIYEPNGKMSTKDGKKIFKVKNFELTLNEAYETKQEFKITLEYRQDGINLSFIDPKNGKRQYVKVDTTAKPGK